MNMVIIWFDSIEQTICKTLEFQENSAIIDGIHYDPTLIDTIILTRKKFKQ